MIQNITTEIKALVIARIEARMPSNLIPISVIKGNTSLEAHHNAKRQMLKNMNRLLREEYKEETPFYLEALWNNYEGQVIFGNTNTKL
jgi:hypothetical protein